MLTQQYQCMGECYLEDCAASLPPAVIYSQDQASCILALQEMAMYSLFAAALLPVICRLLCVLLLHTFSFSRSLGQAVCHKQWTTPTTVTVTFTTVLTKA